MGRGSSSTAGNEGTPFSCQAAGFAAGMAFFGIVGLVIGAWVWVTNLGPASYASSSHAQVAGVVVSQSEDHRDECDITVRAGSSTYTARLKGDECNQYPADSSGDAVRIEVWNGKVTTFISDDSSFATKDRPGPYTDAGPILIIGAVCLGVAVMVGALGFGMPWLRQRFR